jgi:BirA family biotin operon repressor/biotin-[acetyl-CoA-carboxylase] ligase
MILSGPITHYLQTPSTQDEAKLTLTGVHWTTNQTAGKGRFDRQWYSEPGRSLAVSIALPEYKEFAKPYLIGMWFCLALAQEFDLRVQWPNDLVIDRKKVCGVLTEVIEGVPIIGFGINVGLMNFPTEIAYRASSLANEGRLIGTPVEVFERIILMLNSLGPVPSTWAEMAENWNLIDETKGKIFKLQDGRMGIAEGVSNQAELIWNDHGKFEMVTCADALWGFNKDFETN